MPTDSQPTATATERIVVVDVLRAFALFGIIITHAAEAFIVGQAPAPDWITFNGLDRLVGTLATVLTYGKFYTIFSFLFGLSFAIQMRSAESKGRSFRGRFAWRLIVLALIALLHGAFFSGDVLIIYALLGLLLIPMRKRKTKTLVIVGLILALNAPGILLGTAIAVASSQTLTPEQTQARAQMQATQMEGARKAYAIKKSGSAAELIQLNLVQGQVSKLAFMVVSGRLWVTYGLFLLGLCAGRLEIFRNTPENRGFFRKLLMRTAPVALVTTVVAVAYPVGLIPLSMPNLAAWVSYGLQQASLSAVYLAAVTLLFWGGSSQSWLRHLAPAGRMGLTTYVMQSAFGIVVFYGLGFGLLGELGIATCVGISIAFFGVQVLLAKLWLARFRMGPLEWLWRALTYFTLHPGQR